MVGSELLNGWKPCLENRKVLCAGGLGDRGEPVMWKGHLPQEKVRASACLQTTDGREREGVCDQREIWRKERRKKQIGMCVEHGTGGQKTVEEATGIERRPAVVAR
jgi:hypothetical protein